MDFHRRRGLFRRGRLCLFLVLFSFFIGGESELFLLGSILGLLFVFGIFRVVGFLTYFSVVKRCTLVELLLNLGWLHKVAHLREVLEGLALTATRSARTL